MHEQSLIDSITATLDTSRCKIVKISLLADEPTLRLRLSSDVVQGIRFADVIDRSVARINLYQELDTIKVDTSNKTVQEIVHVISAL